MTGSKTVIVPEILVGQMANEQAFSNFQEEKIETVLALMAVPDRERGLPVLRVPIVDSKGNLVGSSRGIRLTPEQVNGKWPMKPDGVLNGKAVFILHIKQLKLKPEQAQMEYEEAIALNPNADHKLEHFFWKRKDVRFEQEAYLRELTDFRIPGHTFGPEFSLAGSASIRNARRALQTARIRNQPTGTRFMQSNADNNSPIVAFIDPTNP